MSKFFWEPKLALIVAATVIILCGIAGVAYTSRDSAILTERAVTAGEEWKDRAEHALAAGEKWRDAAEQCDELLVEAIENARRAIKICNKLEVMTPFHFAYTSTQDAENIEFTIDGQLVYLVGPGAQAALEELQ